MAAPIVYEGAMATKEPPRNGLFKNMKFWVGHRVPQRLNWVQGIQNNGGKVVPLEKNADYLIADDARKDGPLGSYSYKFIDESIKAGVLQNLENYLCSSATRQPKTTESQPTSSISAQKTTRRKFTDEDDSILMRWVIKHERQGKHTFGNEIYKSLEAKYPQHTYQSWRDRWVKKLQYLPRPEVTDDEQSPRPSKPVVQSSPARPSPAGTQQVRREERVSTQSPATRRARVEFTEDDDEILIKHIQECIRLDKPLQGIKIFRDLANDFPQHSEQSWRARWIKQLTPKLEDKISQWQSGIIPGDEAPEESQEARPKSPTEQDTDKGREPPGTPVRRETPRTQPSPHAATTPLRPIEANTPHTSRTSNKKSNQAVTPANGTNVAESENENHRQPRIAETPTKDPRAETNEPAEASPSFEQLNSNDMSMRGQFYRDYRMFLPEHEALIPWHTIKGRTFELWDLWQAIVAQKMEPSERDWHLIAETLGYDWVLHDTVHDELRKCYDDYLAAFEDYCIEFTNAVNASDASDDDEEGEEDGQASEVPLPSSPPVVPSLKRSFDTHRLSSDHAYPESSPKRRKIARDTEIPSTPDTVNGTSRLRRQSGVDETPTVRRSVLPVIDDETEENESRDIIQDLPTLPRAGKKPVEPETQDFRFDPETQNVTFETQENVDMESQFNITPSQQLRQESDAVSIEDEAASPTPKAKTRNANPGSSILRKRARNPFRQDSDDETSGPPESNQTINIPTDTAIVIKAKRRSLPKSFTQRNSPAPGPSTAISPREQAQPRPIHRPVPVRETPDDVIDRFGSLGYPRDIVLRALRATTWRLGDAGHVMEKLKRGEELPQKTHGVWTQRDDDTLQLITSAEPPKDEKEERKRARARKRLELKHGPELMELRRKYLWEGV
ncbi:TRF2-interacting telomeric protein/Rap1 C terminal domain-containing protein [Hypoxylon trugodes]|uniref:TRF2-interacting telomeric protein/Rap1 C terminal domain-containing protein n=1 Tax=Hypoxylon trugodes TaxID=326681 RepID=UPI002190FE78|nr:TRF2-interacting telomeric protein/Rap1 C terminal domain-containing protein [Hypoxylon trugodes]KAI1387208.1 TRF2-interacting telomeric protein/Rap1 C terminal domain-containing protein [Hypoxylon trugodes]